MLGITGLFYVFYPMFDGKFLLANNVDPVPHNVMSGLGLHCLPITLLHVFR